MQVSPIENKTFGAVITGVKLPVIDEADFAQIKSEFLKYGFLLFPGQHLSVDENTRFGQWLSLIHI